MSMGPREAIQAIMRVLLRPYQRIWLDVVGRHPWTAMLGCRQPGKDHTFGSLPAMDCMVRRHQWNMFSATERQAILWMKRIKQWVHALQKGVYDLAGIRLPGPHKGGDDSKTQLELSNGSLVICHPSTVKAAVGNPGSVAFNEVGILNNAGDLFEAVLPIVEGQRDQGIDAKMIIFSNACHQGHWWHQWWKNLDVKNCGSSKRFAKITYTYDNFLTDMGFSIKEKARKIAEKIEALGLAAYEQWYGCVFRGMGEGFFDPDLLTRQTWTPEQLKNEAKIGCTQGYDPGRVKDPCAIAPNHLCKSRNRFMQHVWAESNVPYASQRLRASNMGREHGPCYGTGVDTTGPQCQVREEMVTDPLVTHCGRIYAYPFGIQSKWRMFRGWRAALESGRAWLPPDDIELRMQMEAIRTTLTTTGLPTLTWSRGKTSDGKNAHGDKAVSGALAERVVKEPGVFGRAA